jgi:hypothetical protein
MRRAHFRPTCSIFEQQESCTEPLSSTPDQAETTLRSISLKIRPQKLVVDLSEKQCYLTII